MPWDRRAWQTTVHRVTCAYVLKRLIMFLPVCNSQYCYPFPGLILFLMSHMTLGKSLPSLTSEFEFLLSKVREGWFSNCTSWTPEKKTGGEERKGTRWIPLLILVLWFCLALQRPSSSTCHQDPGPHSPASSLSVHMIPRCQVFLPTSGPLHMLALLLGMLFPLPLCFPPIILQISIKHQAAFLGPQD